MNIFDGLNGSVLKVVRSKRCQLAMLAFLGLAPAQAILVDDSWNLTASNQLATDFINFPSFSATGKIGITEGTANFDATGVLIGADWVLTAAHNWTNTAVTGLTFTVGGTLYNGDLSQRFQHPLWNAAPAPLTNATVGISQGWDIALFRLTAPVIGIAPALIYTGAMELGSQVYTLGFGRTGTGSAVSVENASGAVHAISNTVDRATNQDSNGFKGGQIFFDFDNGAALGNTFSTEGLPDQSSFSTTLNPAGTISGTTSTATQRTNGTAIIEGGTAQGDSGGPTFISDGGLWKVAGVTSWGINPADSYGANGKYGDISAMTRVSEHATWINSVIVPEPSVGVMLLVAAGILGMIQRRRPATRWIAAA